MKTKFNWIGDDWKRVKNHCRTTANKAFTENEPTEKFKRQLLISEHSPIRLLEVDWSWEDIYSWVATHWSRHKFEKFISTQRDDRLIDDVPRGKKPQDAPVKFDGYANMQSLIDAFRKRLCYQASPETRELAEDFKMALHETHPEMADVLVPNCIYRFGCPEFETCGYFEGLSSNLQVADYDSMTVCPTCEKAAGYNSYFGSYVCNHCGWMGKHQPRLKLSDIQTRYDVYNERFYQRRRSHAPD